MGGPLGTLGLVLWFAGTTVLVGSVLTFVVWMLLAASRRKRRAFALSPNVCPGCAYELPAADAQTCPECGRRTTAGEQQTAFRGEQRAARRAKAYLVVSVGCGVLGAGMLTAALLLS